MLHNQLIGKKARFFNRPFFGKYLNLAFKAILLLLLAGMLYTELTAQKSISNFCISFWPGRAWTNLGWLFLTLLLMPFNWLAETQKWYQCVRLYEPMSRWTAVRAVLAGVAVSLFTPNRVGEYGGRILFVRPENRWKAAIANLVGNFAQYLVVGTAGAIGVVWMMDQYWHLKPRYIHLFSLAATIGLGLLFLLYFNIKAIIPIARKIPALNRIKRFAKEIHELEHFSRTQLFKILQWATLRYGIYATQYFFLLIFFDLKISILEGFSGIFVLFLLQTSIPLPPILGLMARGNLAVFVWGQVGANEIGSLAATFTLWIINLILPALVGTFSLLYVNIAKTFVYENDSH